MTHQMLKSDSYCGLVVKSMCPVIGLLAIVLASTGAVQAQSVLGQPQNGFGTQYRIFQSPTTYRQVGNQPQTAAPSPWGQGYRQPPSVYPPYRSNYPRYYGGSPYPSEICPGLPLSSVTLGQPDGLGGYVFDSYSASPCGDETVPSVYGLYDGFPGYIIIDQGWVANILPISSVGYGEEYASPNAPSYQVNEYNYTVNNYYSNPTAEGQSQQSSPSSSSQSQQSRPTAQGYDLALGDIQQAWTTGDITLLKKHLPPSGSSIEVGITGQVSYAIEADHFGQVTEDAFNNLTTYSFVVTKVKKLSDGSVVGYVTHTYAPVGDTSGQRNTMYLALRLSFVNGTWMITRIDSSTEPMDVA